MSHRGTESRQPASRITGFQPVPTSHQDSHGLKTRDTKTPSFLSVALWPIPVFAQTRPALMREGGAMYWLPAVFALLVMAAGWYYIFYSPAATRLTGVESRDAN